MSVFDAATNTFVREHRLENTVRLGIGRPKQDDFTLLIIINFTLTELRRARTR
jgi:hypothetical protein